MRYGVAVIALLACVACMGDRHNAEDDVDDAIQIDWDLTDAPTSDAVEWDQRFGADTTEGGITEPLDVRIATSVGTFDGALDRLAVQRWDSGDMLAIDLYPAGAGMSVDETVAAAQELADEWSMPMDNIHRWAATARPVERQGRIPPVRANTNSTVIGPDGARASLRTIPAFDARDRAVALAFTIYWPERDDTP